MLVPHYEQDFLLWTEQQSSLLRAGRLNELDVEHLIEEIEAMGSEQKTALQSLMRVILVHLLKLALSPAQAPRAKWIDEVLEFRAQIEYRMKTTPSLKHHAKSLLQDAWLQARRNAQKSFVAYGETVKVPTECPYTLEQVLDQEFWPEQNEN